jgi:hypothetical protein
VSEALFASNSKGGPADARMDLPWKVDDWSTQRPWEAGGGYSHNGFNTGLLVHFGRKIQGPVGAVFSATARHTYGYQSWADQDVFEYELRFGAQFSKFLTTNIEFLGTPFHRMTYIPSHPTPTYSICGDSECPSTSTNPTVFNAAEGVGVHGAIRAWLMPWLTLKVQYGTEYNFEDADFSADPVTFLPCIHF